MSNNDFPVYPVPLTVARGHVARASRRDVSVPQWVKDRHRSDLATARIDREIRASVQMARGAAFDDAQVAHLVGLLLSALGLPGADASRIEDECRAIAVATGHPSAVRTQDTEQ